MRNFYKYILTLVAILLVTTLSAQTYNGGTWYSLYDATVREKGTDSGGEIYTYTNIFTPSTGTVVFYTKMSKGIFGGNPDDYTLNVGGKTVSVASKQTSYTEKYASGFDPNTTSIKFSYNYTVAKNLTRTVYIDDIKLPLAKHILLNDGTTYGTSSITVTDNNLATAEGKTSTNYYTIKLRSFLASGDITITSSNSEFHFGNGATSVALGVANNYCASANGSGNCSATTLGNIDNYFKNIYFSPSVKYNKNTRSTTITISDGTNKAYVYLSAPVIPTYFFKAEAIASPAEGGTVTARFPNGQNTYSLVATNKDIQNMSADVTFTAVAPAEGYVFEGWKKNPSDETFYKQGTGIESFTETITSSALNPNSLSSQLTYYAIFSKKFTATITGSNYSNKLVGESFPVDYTFINTQTTTPTANDTDPFYYVINHDLSTNASTKDSPRPTEVIDYKPSNNTITALNEGTATITFYQKATDSHNAVTSASYTITVIKYTPSFTWHDQANTVATTEYFNTPYAPFFVSSSTTNNTSATLSYSSSDVDVATLSAGSTAQSLDLTTYNKEASTTLTVKQAENYYWYGKEESKTVTPIDPNNHVPFTIDTEDKMRNVFYYGHNETLEWDNGIKVTDGNGVNWDDRYIIIEFTGIPKDISFDFQVSGVTTYEYWYVDESPTGQNGTWTRVWNTQGEGNDYESGTVTNQPLLPTTRYLKLCYSGNYGGIFKNVTVTELNEFEAELSEADKGIINEDVLDFGANPVNKNNYPQKTFDLRYANAGYKVSLSVEGDDRFTVSPTSITTIGGEKYGTYMPITVTYNTSSKHSSASGAKIVIEDEKGFYEEVLLKGSTYPSSQNLSWTTAWSADKPIVILNQTVTDAATNGMTDELPIKYKTSDDTVFEISADGYSFTAKNTGEATITAYQEGNDEYAYAEISKTFMVTDKHVQIIMWEDDLTSLYVGDPDITLTAKVYLLDAQTHEWNYNAERTALLTYSSSNTDIVSVNGNVLSIHAIGECSLTATVEGNELYEATSLSIPVNVREVPQGCEDVLLPIKGYDLADKFEYNPYSGTEQHTLEIDRNYGIPGHLQFYYYGRKAWGTLEGQIQVTQSTDGGNTWQELGDNATVTPGTTEQYSAKIPLSREATHLRFTRISSKNLGYHLLQYIAVYPAQYIESETINFGNIAVNSNESEEFTVSYSNNKDTELAVTVSNPLLSLSSNKIIDECGKWGEQTLTVTLKPNQIGAFEDYIVVKDEITQITCSIKVVANVVKGTPMLEWNPQTTTLYESNDWREGYTKNATSTIDVPIVYTMTPNEYAHFDADGRLVIDKAGGTITITASQEETLNFIAASVSKTFTISDIQIAFIGGGSDQLWSNMVNWNLNRLPRTDESVIIEAPAVLSTHAIVHGVTFNGGTLTISATGGLTVGEGGVTSATDNSITIENNLSGVGYFRIDPTATSKPSKVTVNYTPNAKSGSPRDEQWQYVGAPGKDMNMSGSGLMIYHWSEQNGWLQANTAMQPFVGYALTRTTSATDAYVITASPIYGDTTITLTQTDVSAGGMGGSNLFVNSYLAPIDLSKFDDDDFSGVVDKTFYLFNSGSWHQWQNQGGADNTIKNGSSPGQYYAISSLGAGFLDANKDQTTIPPMQGVYVVAGDGGGKINLNYEKHIYNGTATDMNRPMRAPQMHDEDFMRIRLQVNSENSGADRMYVIQHPECTKGYDNGYDAKNIISANQANIYTNEKDGQMEISFANQIDSTWIGFQAGEDSEYTLTFSSLIGEEIYLYDSHVDTLILMTEEGQYTFLAQANSVNDKRFRLILRAEISEDINTSDDEWEAEARFWVNNKIVYIDQAPAYSTLAVYSASGLVMSAPYEIQYTPCTIDMSYLPNGVYILRLNNQAYKFVCK